MNYEVKYVASSQAAALAGVMRRIIAAGKQGATIILPNGNLNTGTRATVATHKRSALRNGIHHPEAARDWEVLANDQTTVIGTFTVEVGQCAAVVGAPFIRQVRPIVGTDDGSIDELQNDLFGDSFDDLPDAPEVESTDDTDSE